MPFFLRTADVISDFRIVLNYSPSRSLHRESHKATTLQVTVDD